MFGQRVASLFNVALDVNQFFFVDREKTYNREQMALENGKNMNS